MEPTNEKPQEMRALTAAEVKALPDDPVEALESLLQFWPDPSWMAQRSEEFRVKNLAIYMHWQALVQRLLERIPKDNNGQWPGTPGITDDPASAADATRGFVIDALKRAKKEMNLRRNRAMAETQRSLIDDALSGRAVIQFTADDITRIQSLIDQLRQAIRDSEDLSAEHCHRLLRKLNKLQEELDKTVSDIDRFFGLLIEVNLIARQYGETADNIVETTGKIVKIATLAAAVVWGGSRALPPSQVEVDELAERTVEALVERVSDLGETGQRALPAASSD